MAENNKEILNKFIEENLPQLQRIASRAAAKSHRIDPDDLLNDAVLKISSSVERGNEIIPEKLAGLFAIAIKNLLVDYALKKNRRPLHFSVDHTKDYSADITDRTPGPIAHLETAELEQQIEEAVRNITPEQRGALKLRISGFSYKEIADKVGIPRSTAAGRISYARQKIKEQLTTMGVDIPQR
jgi:RNA polymerase sigma factor (sigma-70 family)